jgi:hypothetical protein
MSTLKRSERNCIIEDFRNGIINPNYEVIQTKTKGRYTVRKRKVPLTEEQIAALDNGDDEYDDDDVEEPVTPQRKTQRKTQPRKTVAPEQYYNSSVINDLQNQLNQQMLYRLNELTNKVVKLKTWKKKVKQDLYSEDVEPQVESQVEQKVEPQVESQVEPQVEQMEQNYVEPHVEQNGYEYLNRIPQEYVEQQYSNETMQQYETMQPFNKRSRIDYSKFGF